MIWLFILADIAINAL